MSILKKYNKLEEIKKRKEKIIIDELFYKINSIKQNTKINKKKNSNIFFMKFSDLIGSLTLCPEIIDIEIEKKKLLLKLENKDLKEIMNILNEIINKKYYIYNSEKIKISNYLKEKLNKIVM